MKTTALTHEETTGVLCALRRVLDPCSVAAGKPINIVDFGLVTALSVDEQRGLRVTLRSTFPGCTMIPHFAQAAEAQLEPLSSFRSVEVEIDDCWTWTPQEMSEAGRRIYESRRHLPLALRPWARSDTALPSPSGEETTDSQDGPHTTTNPPMKENSQ